MYCVKLEWQDVDIIIWLINYADPSGALWKPLIDKIKMQCESNEWQVAAHYMPDGSMMEWAYNMEWMQMPLQNPMQSLQWEETLPPMSMENEEDNWLIQSS